MCGQPLPLNPLCPCEHFWSFGKIAIRRKVPGFLGGRRALVGPPGALAGLDCTCLPHQLTVILSPCPRQR